jgi:hypothetical protein
LRDARIDFFRGLSIYMIFVDHVAGDPFSKITYHALGFSDAAETFVFLSGLACGIAYSRVLARRGLAALFQALARRSLRIYFYYALSSCAIILLVTAAVARLSLADPLGIPVEHPVSAMLSALCLVSPPLISGILVFCIAMTLVLIPALLIAGNRHWLLALGISVLTWVAAQGFAGFLAPLSHRWYVNPFAWQFLFVIGLIFGMKWDSRQPLLPLLAQRRWLIAAAWTIVIGAALHRVLYSHSGFDIAWLRLEADTLAAMKENLSPIRLVHFLSVALLVAVYFRRDSALLKWPVVTPVIKTGMHSLEVFALSCVLDFLANIIVMTGSPSFSARLLIDGGAFLLLALTAMALAYRRTVALDLGVWAGAKAQR